MWKTVGRFLDDRSLMKKKHAKCLGSLKNSYKLLHAFSEKYTEYSIKQAFYMKLTLLPPHPNDYSQ